MKMCKQCGKNKPEDAFRRNTARGKGIYKTTQGYHNFCKDCESINSRAIALEKIPCGEEKAKQLLVDYYRSLEDAGLGIASAVAGRYLGKDKSGAAAQPTGLEAKLLQAINSNQVDEVQVHVNKVTNRSYASVKEAINEHIRLETAMRAKGCYEDTDKLLEDWEVEEDE